MANAAENRIQHFIKAFADIVTQESKDKIAVLLQKQILPSITAIGVRVAEMLAAIQLNHQTAR